VPPYLFFLSLLCIFLAGRRGTCGEASVAVLRSEDSALNKIKFELNNEDVVCTMGYK